jgi:hypothetical protein
MAERGGQLGNENAKNGKIWQQAIKRALARKAKGTIHDGLDKIADNLVEAASDKADQWAIKEIGDRLDGKPAQSIEGTGAGGIFTITITSDDETVL